MEGQRPRLEVALEMEDLLHNFVSSGFADRPDASACRTTTSSTRSLSFGLNIINGLKNLLSENGNVNTCSPLYRLQPPRNAAEVFLTNFPRDVIYGCGDLIFWSHVIFTPVFIMIYQKWEYKPFRFIKVLAQLVK
ncbi:hypothetical protein ACQ4PT_035482 [Festuca glaucescens]